MKLRETIKKVLREQTTITKEVRRRVPLIDLIVDKMLENMYPCDYDSADQFLAGLIEEMAWFKNDFEELKNLERAEIENYLIDYRYDEIIEYYNERCSE